MKYTNKYHTATYETGTDGFYVDIVSSTNSLGNKECDAFLWEESCGLKMLMFGYQIEVENGCPSREYFLDMVAATLPRNIEIYKDEYMG